MLLNLHKKKWTDGLILRKFDTHSKTNEDTVQVCGILLLLRRLVCKLKYSLWSGIHLFVLS
jgi:hypothetical protein